MDQTKPWYQSTAIMGALASLLAFFVKTIFKIDVGPEYIQPIIDNCILVFGAVMGLIGRITATKQVTLTKQP